MGFARRVSEGPNETVVSAAVRKSGRSGLGVMFAGCVLFALVGSAMLLSQSKPASQSASSSKALAAEAPSQGLTDAQMSQMSSNELAHYVFEHHGCNGCHTLGANGKLGFTERGKQVGKGFEGCISLLTSMNGIAQVKEADRNADQKQKAARFQEFGCTTCHQITPGKLGLTNYGTKLKSLHMACTDVENILAAQKR